MKLGRVAQWSLAWAMALLSGSVFAAGEVISINFGSNYATVSDQEGDLGLYPVPASAWIDTAEFGNAAGTVGSAPVTLTSIIPKDQYGRAYLKAQIYLSSNGNTWSNGNNTTPVSRLLRGYLDDQNGTTATARQAGIKITNMPFGVYKVYVYFNRDSAEGTAKGFPSYRINGTFYYGTGTATAATAANQAWGVVHKNELVEGENVLVVNSNGATLEIVEPRYADGSAVTGTRGCISAIQIVNMGTITSNDLIWQGTIAGNGTWDTSSTNNAWLNGTIPAPFTAGNNVGFPSLDSTISAQVTIPDDISVGYASFYNTDTAYTFQGPGRAAFTKPLHKDGTATTTFNTPVGLSTNLIVSAGTLTLNNGLYTDLTTDSPAFESPIAINRTGTLDLTMPSEQTQTLSSAITGTGTLNLSGPGAFALTGNCSGFTGLLNVTDNAAVSGITPWSSMPSGTLFIDSGATFSSRITAAAAGAARTITGSGTLHLLIGASSAASSIAGANFTGTLRLTQAPTPETNWKFVPTSLTLSPEATMIIDPGAQLYLTAALNALYPIHLSGDGNGENLGAIRLADKELNNPLVLLGNTSIGTGSGGLGSPVTVHANLTSPVTLTLGRPGDGPGNIVDMTISGALKGTEQAPLNLNVNAFSQKFTGSFENMGSLTVSTLSGFTAAAATFSSTNTIAFTAVTNDTSIVLSGGTQFTVSETLSGSGSWTIGSGSRLTFEQTQTSTAPLPGLAGTLALKGTGNTFLNAALQAGSALELTADPNDPAVVPLTLSNFTVTSSSAVTVAVSGVPSGIPADGLKLIAWPEGGITGSASWQLPSEPLYAQYDLLQKADGLYLIPFGTNPGTVVKTLTWPSESGVWETEDAWVLMTDRATHATFRDYDALFLDDVAGESAVTLTVTESKAVGAIRAVANTTAFTFAAGFSDNHLTLQNGMTKYGDADMTIRAPFYSPTNMIVAAGTLTINTPYFGLANTASSSTPFAVNEGATLTFTGLTNQTFQISQLLTGSGSIRFQNSTATLAGSSMVGYRGVIEVEAGANLTVGFGGGGGIGALEKGSFHVHSGGTLYLGAQHVAGWKVDNAKNLFATVEQGGRIIKTNTQEEYATRAFILRGGSLLNQTTANSFDFRSGSKITATSGFTSWIGPENVGSISYPGAFGFFNDSVNGTRVEFAVEADATLRVTAPLSSTIKSGVSGLLKTGPGVMLVEASSTYTAPTEIESGIFSLNATHQNGTHPYTVGINGFLRGSGRIAGSGTVTVSGTIAGGRHLLSGEEQPMSANTLSLATNVVFNAGSIVRVDNFSGDTSLVPGVIDIGGTVILNGLVTVLINTNPNPANLEKSYKLINWNNPPAVRTFTLNTPAWLDAGYVVSVKNDGLYLETFGGNDRILRWVATQADWYEVSGAWVDDASEESAAFTTTAITNTSIRLPDVPGSATATAQLLNARPSVDSALFSNVDTDYSLSGASNSRLIITGDLRKNGTGKVTINPMVLFPSTVFVNAGTLTLNNGISTSDSFAVSYLDPIYIGEEGTLEVGVGNGLQQALGVLTGGGTFTKRNAGTLSVSGLPNLAGITVAGGTFKANNTSTLNGYPAVTLQNGGVFEWTQVGGTDDNISNFSINGDGGFVFRTNYRGSTMHHRINCTPDVDSFTKAGIGLLVLGTDTFVGVPDLWLDNSVNNADGIVLNGSVSESTPLLVRNFGTLPNATAYVLANYDTTPARNKPILTDLTQDCEFNGVFLEDSNRHPALTLATSDTGTRKAFTLKGTSTTTGPLTVNDGIDLNLMGSWYTGASVQVNTGATMRGTGSAANVSVAMGGTLSGGIDGSGTLALSGTTTFADGSVFEVGISARNTATLVTAQTCSLASGSTVLVRVVNPSTFYLAEALILSWSVKPTTGAFMLDPDSPLSIDYILTDKSDGLYLSRRPRQMWIMMR